MPDPRHLALRRRLFGAVMLVALVAQPHSPGAAVAIQPIDALPGFPPVPFAASPASRIASDQAPAPDAAPADEEDVATQLSEALGRARRHSGAPGLSMAVIAADGTRWQGVSGNHAGRGRPLSADDALTVGSITKTFTAAIVLQLAEEGRVDLDAPVSRYLSNVRLVRNGATVRELLNHTSGIPDLYRSTVKRLRSAPQKSLSSNAVLGTVPPSSAKHGTDYAYSNTNYYLLGHVIELVTGRTFQEELQSRITDPLGLDATRLVSGDDPLLPKAWSSAFWTAGAMAATPADLATWGRALYAGDHLSPESRAQMLDFSDGNHYGLGAQHLPFEKWRAPGHSGLLYRNTSLLIHLPARKATVAIVATAAHTDLESALTRGYGGPSLIELVEKLGG